MAACAVAHTGRSEGSLQESVLSFYYVGLRDGAQVRQRGSRSLYLLTGLVALFIKLW